MRNVSQFLKEVQLEMSRVVWPTSHELFGALIVVIILVIAFALYIGVIDYVFYKVAQNLFAQAQ